MLEQCSQPEKNNAAAGYQGAVKIELLKGAGLLPVAGKLVQSDFFSESS